MSEPIKTDRLGAQKARHRKLIKFKDDLEAMHARALALIRDDGAVKMEQPWRDIGTLITTMHALCDEHVVFFETEQKKSEHLAWVKGQEEMKSKADAESKKQAEAEELARWRRLQAADKESATASE